MSQRPPAPLRADARRAAAAAALQEAEDERNAPDPTLKWVGIGDKPTPEFVSRCGYFKARRAGKKWRLYVRDDPDNQAEYEDTEQEFPTKKQLYRECETIMAEAEAEAEAEVPFG